jgi:MYXO-CTERM domain-containing protein
MRRKISSAATILGSMAACLFIPSSLLADTFAINDLTDTVSVTDVDNSGRLFGVFCSGENCEFDIHFVAGTAAYAVTYNGITFTPITAGLNMLEPGTGTVSDTLQQTDDSTSATFWQFSSDTETPLAGIPNAPNLVEDGTAQSTLVIDYLNSDKTQIGQDVIKIQSDVENTPEPSARPVALAILLAVLGVAFVRRRSASCLHC